MSSIYIHFSWFVFIFLGFLFFFLVSLFVTFINTSIFLSFPIFSTHLFSLDFSLYLDFFSLWFSSVILLISSVIIIYSYFYISPYFNPEYFLWFTVLFIVSIIFVVIMSNLFYIILGWDGLGLVSFFLIVFYQNSSSITSGLFTLLINRLGDGFYLLSIGFITLYYSDYVYLCTSSFNFYFLPLFLILTFITNSAIYPFSSWLPMAIAAPTPISALVHSSTLVTSGLYLMMRYSYILYSSVNFIKFLVVASLFTSFYAGLNTIFETDLNNLIALSTLSHLGFIGFSFSSGMLLFSFFHLLSHALFKSLLFIAMGDIIIALSHSQDIRYLSSGIYFTPFSSFIIIVSLLNLLGIPNITGYFSNDLVLELFCYSNSGYCLIFMVYLNVFFTFFYTYQLFYYTFSLSKVTSFLSHHFPSTFHVILLCFLGIVSVAFGSFFINFICPLSIFPVIPFELKFLPLAINLLVFLYLFLYLIFRSSSSSFINYYFSSILFLTPLILSSVSNSFYLFSFYIVNDQELGFLNKFLHSSSLSLLSSFMLFALNLYRFNFIYYLFFLSLLIFCFSCIF